jgi:predicted DNA-binding protein with PD1-like motif
VKSYRMEEGATHVFRVPRGEGLVETVTAFAAEHGIEAAWFTYLGAVNRASLRYYDQDAGEYHNFVLDQDLEILSGTGNVSLLDGAPFVHTHAAFGDREGKAWGGHVNQGTNAFIIEVRLEELSGDRLERLPDEALGLSVWEC